METLLIIVGVIILGFLALAKKYVDDGGWKNKSEESEETVYDYRRAKFFMTRSEHELYDVLQKAVGGEYRIFAQVHLSTILDHKVKGQSWRGALSHIHRKSVDFVLCEKDYLSPQLIIELDGKSHNREDRQERDTEVERILEDAGLPLLRIQNHGTFDAEAIKEQVNKAIHVQQTKS